MICNSRNCIYFLNFLLDLRKKLHIHSIELRFLIILKEFALLSKSLSNISFDNHVWEERNNSHKNWYRIIE